MTSEGQFKQHRTPPYRGRFAPSPTGPLHFGSLVAALGSFLRARSQRGEWRMRVEDIDTPRVVPGAADMQLDALRRFGLEWDGDVVWQSRRQDAYCAALARLEAAGLLFSCRCSRSELGGAVHRRCVAARNDGPAALRLRVPDREISFLDAIRGPQTQNLAHEVGDVVLRRTDGLIAYQLAVVVDDGDAGVTEVVRGADLIDSTARQIFLQSALGLPHPGYAHLPLALDAHGHKLGKSQQALALDPSNPLPALRAAWRFLGQPAEALAGKHSVETCLQAAVDAFSMERIPAANRHVESQGAPDGSIARSM
ncbi:tRNA glutamyl-Q(34) synthetase GluQRS [Xanthomonadaceae bacterium JHOS43]|nr:tRNA glutamyl-Q(34) synthetase GluQRS [Xanthomonadaceae bacterium JHOS43]